MTRGRQIGQTIENAQGEKSRHRPWCYCGQSTPGGLGGARLPGRAECCGERPLWEGEEVRGEVRQRGDHLHPTGSGHPWGLAAITRLGRQLARNVDKEEVDCIRHLRQRLAVLLVRWAIDYDQIFTLLRYQPKTNIVLSLSTFKYI